MSFSPGSVTTVLSSMNINGPGILLWLVWVRLIDVERHRWRLSKRGLFGMAKAKVLVDETRHMTPFVD